GGADPLPRRLGAPAVLRDREHDELQLPELGVEGLPARQVEAAPSPRGPRDEKDLGTPIIREPVSTALEVREGDVRGLERAEALPEVVRRFSEDPDVVRRVVAHRLAARAGEPRGIQTSVPD